MVEDAEGIELSFYEINDHGHFMKWGRTNLDGSTLEYIYWPFQDFGNIRFPAWGASTDVYWRYNYVEVKLS